MTAPKITAAAVAVIVITAALIAVLVAAAPAATHCPDGMADAYQDFDRQYTSEDGENRTHPATIHTCIPD